MSLPTTSLSFQARSLSMSTLRLAEADAVFGHFLSLGHHLGGVQQRLGRNAADVEADAAQRGITFHQHHLHAEVGGAECGGVAAGTGAEHQHVASRSAGGADRRLGAGGWGPGS